MNLLNTFTPNPKLFILQEFLAPEIFNQLKYENKLHIGWRLLNPRMLWTIVQLRVFYEKPIYINNWDSGGLFKYRGLRPFDCPEGAEWSGHKFGNCIDFYVKNINSAEVRRFIIDNRFNLEILQYITSIENFDGMCWVHIGFENVEDDNGFLIFDNK